MKKSALAAALAAAFLVAHGAVAAASQHGPEKSSAASIERGRYLVRISGCNDCHTPGYAEKGGEVPESYWLTGDALGWRGPWGTTYPVNLRLYVQGMSENECVRRMHTLSARPPMPWFALRAMSAGDLRAIYRYVRHLGPAGKPAPEYVAPGQTPSQPYVQFPMPQ
jgi:mono/diheme cytochrome c family protein